MGPEAKDSPPGTVDHDLGLAETVSYSSGDVPRRDEPATKLELTGELGRYRILKRLGAGGMGAVFLAHDSQFDHQVALKVPHFSSNDDRRTIERFYREARAAIKLRHSNICPVYDVGEIDGQHYLAMAYIEGCPLSAFIHPDHPLSGRQIAGIICKIALALQEAHDNGVVHRDLKPGNIMFDEKRKEPIVMDFGLATQVGGSADARLTRAGTLIGSPAYMSPEQVNSQHETVGPPSDIYSLGVILYELLTGRVPFEGPTAVVLGMIAIKDPEPPSQRRPGIAPELEVICMKAMAKKIEDRYTSMREFATALVTYADSLPETDHESDWLAPLGAAISLTVPSLGPTSRIGPSSPTTIASQPERGRALTLLRSAGPWIAGGVGGAVAALVIALALIKPGSTVPNDAAPPENGAAGGVPWANGLQGPPHHPRHEPGELEDFATADRNGDDLLSADEYPMHIILRADANGDLILTRGEFDAAHVRLGPDLFGPPTQDEERRMPRRGPPPPAVPRGRPDSNAY